MNLREFVDPPKKYRPIPYWSLNNELEPAELETQIREIKRRGFGGFVLHAAEGLKTAYLSEDWTNALKRAVEVASELKIEAWLHDEDRGPSGSAGGEVTADNDAFLPQALTWTPALSTVDNNLIEHALAFTLSRENGSLTLTSEYPADPTGAGIFAIRTYEFGHTHFNGDQYADLLNPSAVRAFIDTTHELYAKTFTYEVGEFLPGIMTDGATVNRSINHYPGDSHQMISFPWSPGLPAHFHKLHGYSLLDNLHYLVTTDPEGFGVRHDFWRAVSDLFIDTFTYQLSSWCSNHGLMFAGTVSVPGDFRSMIVTGGAVMPHYEHMSVPAIESPGLRISDIAAVKGAVSAAVQFNKKRILAKVFRSAGYGCSYSDLKSVIDCHIALGVNALSPQQVLYSLAGDRKYDNPPTFSYHHPGSEQMRALNDYIARCSWIARRGRDVSSVLLMMPVSGAYGALDITNGTGGEALSSIETSFRAMVDELVAQHIPFHIGDERITARYGTVDGDTFRIGGGNYTSVILPPSPSWRKPVVDLLETFTGKIVLMGEVPEFVDGRKSDRLHKLTERDSVISIPDDPGRAIDSALQKEDRLLTITGQDGSEARSVLANHRVEAGAHIVFLANTDSEDSIEITVHVRALGGVVELDPSTGRGFRYSAAISGDSTHIETTLAPSGSRIFLIDQTQTSVNIPVIEEHESPLTIEGPYKYRAEKENCLVIDRCSLDIDRRTVIKNAPVWKVKKVIWEKTALDEYRGIQPWILKSRNVRSRTNSTVLTYTFTIRDIPEKIALAMEHSDRFTVTINGTSIDFSPGRWYIDRRMRVLNLEDHVVEGENIIVATTDYLWDTEVSPVYIFGDFAVGDEAEGFPITKKPAELPAGSWTGHGFPFYAGTMIYVLNFNLEKTDGVRYEIDLSGFRGTAASITVNETNVGVILFPPYRGDITGALVNGENVVEVAVAGSLRNLIGPLHNTGVNDGSPTIPDSFQDDAFWTDKYRFVPCGLVTPPRIIRITSAPGE